VSLIDLYFYLTVIAGFAWLAGFVLGRRIGRNMERVRQSLHAKRTRRPVVVNVEVDIAFARLALQNSGYEVVKVEKVVH